MTLMEAVCFTGGLALGCALAAILMEARTDTRIWEETKRRVDATHKLEELRRKVDKVEKYATVLKDYGTPNDYEFAKQVLDLLKGERDAEAYN